MNELIEKTLDQLVDRIENGTGDWVKEWIGSGLPSNYTTKRRYHGVNILLLWSARERYGYSSSRWASYKQWLSAGHQVKKGERSTVVFINKDVVKKDDAGEEQKRYRLFRAAFVFNADQLSDPIPPDVMPGFSLEPIEECEITVRATGAVLREGPDPLYRLTTDEIQMPPIASFTSAAAYYATVFHELVHWTGASSRLDRPMGNGKGGEVYAFEELVAEFGGAFLCAQHGITEGQENNAAYIRGWLQKAGPDRQSALLKAASAASKAAELIMVSRETKEDELAA
jgi:antirestriction protein ArdC